MAKINESALTKGELRKLTSLRKSLGDEIADEAFAKWFESKLTAAAVIKPDPVVGKLHEILDRFKDDKALKLGNTGYTIKKARGRGVEAGFVITKNEPAPKKAKKANTSKHG